MLTDLAYDDPRAQTVFEGREFEARIRFLVPVNASDKEIAEGLVWELGGGEIASDHILVDGGFRDVSVTDVRPTGYQYFTEWDAADGEGGRKGRGRRERVSR